MTGALIVTRFPLGCNYHIDSKAATVISGKMNSSPKGAIWACNFELESAPWMCRFRKARRRILIDKPEMQSLETGYYEAQTGRLRFNGQLDYTFCRGAASFHWGSW